MSARMNVEGKLMYDPRIDKMVSQGNETAVRTALGNWGLPNDVSVTVNCGILRFTAEAPLHASVTVEMPVIKDIDTLFSDGGVHALRLVESQIAQAVSDFNADSYFDAVVNLGMPRLHGYSAAQLYRDIQQDKAFFEALHKRMTALKAE